jgi:quercetin dioxygenase-like cupin family protein
MAMAEPQIRQLRGPGTIDPSDVLTGPVRAISRWHLDPWHNLPFGEPGTEASIFVLAGSGTAQRDDLSIPLSQGTAVTIPLGTSVTMHAGRDGLRLIGVILEVEPHNPRGPS